MREFHRASRGYELMVLINPEVTDEALTATVDAVSGYVTAPGAEITYVKRDTPWGRRRLAYPIQRFRDATYLLIQFMASPSNLTEIERELKLDERVIRYLLVRQEHMHTDDEEEEAQGPTAERAAADSSVATAVQEPSEEQAAGEETDDAETDDDDADANDESDESDEPE